MLCAKCGSSMPEQAAFCPNCGAKNAPPANLCPQCRNPLLPGAQFCNQCGAPIAPRSENLPLACPQCNRPVNPGVVFCPNCGFRQTGAASSSAAFGSSAAGAGFVPPVPQPQYPQAQPQYQQAPQPYQLPQAAPFGQPYQQPYAQPAYGQPAAPPPKKKSKAPVTILVVVLVLAIAGAGTWALFGKKIGRLFMSTEAAYKQIERQALRDSTGQLVDDVVEMTGESVLPEKGGYDVSLKLSLDENLPDVDPGLVAALQNVSINSRLIYDRNPDKPKFFGTVDLLVEEEKLLTLEASYREDQVVIGLPGILEKYISASQDELADLFGSSGIVPGEAAGSLGVLPEILAFDFGIDDDKMKASMNKIIDIMLEHVDEVEKETGQTLTAGGVSAEYDLYVMTVGKESVRTMFVEIFEAIRDDNEIFSLVQRFSSLAAAAGEMPDGEMTREKYKKEINDLIADIKDEEEGEDFSITQKVYVGKDDQVYGRDLLIADDKGKTLFHFKYANPIDGNKEGISLSVESEGENYSMSGSYTVKDEAMTGTITIYDGTRKLATASFKNLLDTKINAVRRLLGEVTVSVEDPGTDYSGPSRFTVKAWMVKDRYWLSLAAEDYFGIEFGYEELPSSQVTFPTYTPDKLVSMSDEEALQGLMDEDAMNKLTDIALRLGISG